MTNMAAVARLAGVSRYTVSKVLNGMHVAEKTRKKVMDACEKLHYSRNLYATNLVRNESFTIGMVISQNFDSFFGEIIGAAEKQAHADGYQLICQCSYGSAEEEAKIIRNFESLRVCGIIAAPVVRNCRLEQWADLEERVPVVHFDCYLNPDSNYVIHDNHRSAALVTEHLISAGRAPAYLGSVHPDTNLAIKNRKKGFVDTVKKHHLKPCFIPTANSAQTADNQEFGYDNMAAYLQGADVPDAVFCATDRIAMGAICVLQERGFVVGRNVLVAGHDNLHFSAFMNPSLTTVAQPKQEMGAESVKSLLSLIRSRESRTKRIQKILKPELIIRQSTMNQRI